MNDILQFLKELDLNNQREWFDANTRYEKTRKDFLDITASLIDEIRKFDAGSSALQRLYVQDLQGCSFFER